MHRDYRPLAHLDVYEADHLDDSDVSEISADARIRAEQEMRRRDRALGLSGRMRRDLLYGMLTS